MKNLKLFDLSTDFYYEKCYKASVEKLWSSKTIRKLFNFFQELFPNHPTRENTELYIMFYPEKDRKVLLWVCKHFEHASIFDLNKIAVFMQQLELEFQGLAFLETLHGSAEKLVIEVLSPRSDAIINNLIKNMREVE